MRERIGDAGVEAMVLEIVPIEGKVLNQEAISESLGVPACLRVRTITKRMVFSAVILPTGVERYLMKGLARYWLKPLARLFQKLFIVVDRYL